MLHSFTLPNHFFYAIKYALDRMTKQGRPPIVNRFETDNTLSSFNKLVLEIECHPFDLLQIGIFIGQALEVERQQETTDPQEKN